MENKSNISELLNKPLWPMTGEEYYELTQFALASSRNAGSGSTPAGQGVWLSSKALAVALVVFELLLVVVGVVVFNWTKAKFT